MLELWGYGIWLNKGKNHKNNHYILNPVLNRNKIYTTGGSEV